MCYKRALRGYTPIYIAEKIFFYTKFVLTNESVCL